MDTLQGKAEPSYSGTQNPILSALAKHPSFLLALRERRRQVEQYGYTGDHDLAGQSQMNLSREALCFVRQAILLQTQGCGASAGSPFSEWPWPTEKWRPPHTKEEALVKAIALLCAELDGILENQQVESVAARLAILA